MGCNVWFSKIGSLGIFSEVGFSFVLCCVGASIQNQKHLQMLILVYHEVADGGAYRPLMLLKIGS